MSFCAVARGRNQQKKSTKLINYVACYLIVNFKNKGFTKNCHLFIPGNIWTISIGLFLVDYGMHRVPLYPISHTKGYHHFNTSFHTKMFTSQLLSCSVFLYAITYIKNVLTTRATSLHTAPPLSALFLSSFKHSQKYTFSMFIHFFALPLRIYYRDWVIGRITFV